MKKRWIAFLLAAVLGLGVGGCAQTEEQVEEETEADEDYGIMYLPLYIYLSVESLDDGVVALRISNHSGYEIEYDEAFALEREEEDGWVTLEAEETEPDDAVYTLEDLEEAVVLCDLNPYGDLGDGHYRIEKDDLYAEFILEDGTLFLPVDPYGR